MEHRVCDTFLGTYCKVYDDSRGDGKQSLRYVVFNY